MAFGIFFLFEDAAELDEVGPSAEVAGFGEVAVGEDVAGAQVHEVGARGKLAGHGDDIVIGSGREASGAEGEAVVRVGHGVEQPLYVLLGTHDARQSQNLDGRVVGVYAHVHAELVARGHDGFEEILHVLAQLLLVYALVELEEAAELLNGFLVVLREVAADEALRLDDDVLHELVLLLGRHGFGQRVGLGEDVSPLACGRGAGGEAPLLACAGTLEDVDVEVGKLGVVEVEVRRAVGVLVQEVGACPVEHGHEVVADGVYAFGREVAERLLIHLNLLVAVGAAVLDGLHHGQRLDDAPAHAVRLDVLTQLVYLFAGPYLAEGHVVQCGDDAFDPNLSELCKGYLILLAKPTPCSFHNMSLPLPLPRRGACGWWGRMQAVCCYDIVTFPPLSAPSLGGGWGEANSCGR